LLVEYTGNSFEFWPLYVVHLPGVSCSRQSALLFQCRDGRTANNKIGSVCFNERWRAGWNFYELKTRSGAVEGKNKAKDFIGKVNSSNLFP